MALACVLGTSEGKGLGHAPCPGEMVWVRRFCIDRYEASMVDAKTGNPLSPFYPPLPLQLLHVFQAWEHWRSRLGSGDARQMPTPAPPLWQQTHDFSPKAVSAKGVVPQGYVSYYTAKQACENAGKRLCSDAEWQLACRGRGATRFPYGARFEKDACNVSRSVHPGAVLHGVTSIGLLDPRMNLLSIDGKDPMLRTTGGTPSCTSRWAGDDAAYDMVGNVDEWVEARKPLFRGGFYARGSTKGCDAQVTNHAPGYYDYSTGVRCCRDASPTRK